MRALKCFIASAFGHNDIDRIYKKTIKPLLRKMKIKPLRVDMIEHNDDIDDKIIELIKNCDFCIADLTYARPSVYYETGYVNGLNKQVIFLARSDHFKPKENDVMGNECIHFDLQMKNIISWKIPSTKLTKRLLSRLNTVTKPLIKDLKKRELAQKDESEFAKMPQIEKLSRISVAARLDLKQRCFTLEDQNVQYLLAAMKKRASGLLIYVYVKPSLKKIDFDRLQYIPHTFTSTSFLDKMNIKKDKMILHIFYCSLRSITSSRIADAIPQYKPHEKLKIYSYGNSKHIHFIDGIKSLSEFKKMLIDHLQFIDDLHPNKK